jgi:hypothetical protein
LRLPTRGGLLAVAAPLLALLLGAAPVAAGGVALPPTGTKGAYGAFGLVDTVDYPGARCIYTEPSLGSQLLTRIKVRPPIVYARDRGPGTDTQVVGWWFDVWTVHDLVLGTWGKVFQSEFRTATATDTRNAHLGAVSWTVSRDANPSTYYLVRVVMLWLPKGPKPPTGSAVVLVAHYADINPYSDYSLLGNCPVQQT